MVPCQHLHTVSKKSSWVCFNILLKLTLIMVMLNKSTELLNRRLSRPIVVLIHDTSTTLSDSGSCAAWLPMSTYSLCLSLHIYK